MAQEYVMSAADNMAISIIWGGFALLCISAVISWLYTAAVLYITGGDKYIRSLASRALVATFDDKDEGCSIFFAVIAAVLSALVLALASAFIINGLLSGLIYVVSSIATVVILLKTAKGAYSLSKRFTLHVKDKDAHKG